MLEDQLDPEVPIEPTDPGYSNKDLHDESFRAIAAQDEPKEPITPEEPKDPIAPAIDPEKIAEDAARKVLAEQEAKQQAEEQERIKADAPEPTDKEKAYTDWAEKFNQEKSRPPTYLEAMEFVEQRAVESIEANQAAKEAEAKAEQERQTSEMAENTKRLDTIIDDELLDLYKANKLTPIKDPTNPSDQGVVEKKALFTKWAEVNAERRREGKPDILSATRIYEFYYQKPNAQPPGADAPVVGNRGAAVAPSSEQNYSYADLKRPWSFFKRS